MDERIKKAIRVLKEGGIVIFPTDTVFGIGCRIDDEKAVKRLFDIRNRPENQAMSVLVDSFEMAQRYLEPVPKQIIDKLIKPYWPGGLTVIFKSRREKVPSLVRGGGENLGVRMPDHDITLSMIKGVGAPILGPSANFHGEPAPYNFSDLDKELVKKADYVLKGETKLGGNASTVIDCSVEPWRIVRHGAIKIQNDRDSLVLIIDTASNREIKVGIETKGRKDLIERKIGENKAQIVLPLLDLLLKKKKMKLEDISSIKVNVKYGSFTGVRVGLSVANALGFALNIPVIKMNERYI